MSLSSITRRIALVAASMVVAIAASPATSASASSTLPTDLLWFNPSSGEVSTWILNGYGNVLGTQAVDWHCDAPSGCSASWRPIGTGDLDNDGNQDLVWFNRFSGEVSTWLMNGYGNVLRAQPIDWHCSLSSGCSTSWVPVGVADVNNDGRQDLVWFNATSGEVSTWLLNGYGNVLRTQALDWRCSTASTCASSWRPLGLGDFNNDGNQDLLWFNRTSGEVSSWLLNGYGNVLGTQAVDWHCAASTLCSAQWRIVGLGDLNGDGNVDVTWHNSGTGEVSSWLLNGHGTVLGPQALDWRCDTGSGCASAWVAIDLVR